MGWSLVWFLEVDIEIQIILIGLLDEKLALPLLDVIKECEFGQPFEPFVVS